MTLPNVLPKSLQDAPRLDQWLGFEAGRVTARSGKVEIGQGILTAFVQIVADELDVAPERIDLVSGRTVGAPDEGFTAGSASVEVGGQSLRLAAAEARARFLDHAARMLGVARSRLAVEDGAILLDGKPTGRDYWTEAGAIDMAAPVTGSAPVKPASARRLIGTSLPRIDLPARVTGAAFLHDFLPADVLHGRVLHRPWPGARLDPASVVLPKSRAGTVEIVREGDFLALVGEDEAAVAGAARALAPALAWSGGTPLPDAASEPEWLLARAEAVEPVADGAELPPLPEGGRELVCDYWRPFVAHASIGPACAVAQERDGMLTVWTHSQGVFPLRAALARALGRDPATVSLIHVPGAGCYGHNAADDVAFDAAFLALRSAGRPVRVIWSRADELAAAPVGAAMSVRIAARLDAGGRPLGWAITVTSAPHARRPGFGGGINLLGAEALPGAPAPVMPVDVPDAWGAGALRNAFALYTLPQRRISRFVADVPVRSSALRGLGANGSVFAIESFMDELARIAGADPVAFRLGYLDDPRARRVIEHAAAAARWAERRAAGETGLGFGFSRYKNQAAYVAVVAEVSVDEKVRVHRLWCSVDAGLVVNPDGAANQIEGGAVQATSWALCEEMRFAGGRPAIAGWEDYPILRFAEVPEVRVEILSPIGDLPPLGTGEAAGGPTIAAIGNALADALGRPIRRMPFSRERLVEALT